MALVDINVFEKNVRLSGQPKFAWYISYVAQTAPMKLDSEWIVAIVQDSTPPRHKLIDNPGGGNKHKIILKSGNNIYTDDAGRTALGF